MMSNYITGAEAVIKALVDNGVEVIFGYQWKVRCLLLGGRPWKVILALSLFFSGGPGPRKFTGIMGTVWGIH